MRKVLALHNTKEHDQIVRGLCKKYYDCFFVHLGNIGDSLELLSSMLVIGGDSDVDFLPKQVWMNIEHQYVLFMNGDIYHFKDIYSIKEYAKSLKCNVVICACLNESLFLFEEDIYIINLSNEKTQYAYITFDNKRIDVDFYTIESEE